MEKSCGNLRIPDIIMKKRNGHELNKEEINFFIQSICDLNNNNSISESQIGNQITKIYFKNFRSIQNFFFNLGAMLTAIYFKSMSFDESFMITKAMMESGSCFKWPNYKNRVKIFEKN
jgi:thymidine phosphorylase